MSLTPKHRSDEATNSAMQEGLVAGGFVLVPALGALYIAMQNKTFMMRTNWQSRTAMAIMPALFAFAYTSENHMHHKMTEIARETQHHTETVKWAEEQHKHLTEYQTKEQAERIKNMSSSEKEVHLMALYRKSIEESGLNVVPGDELQLHHRALNYLAQNPLKVLTGVAVPSVALILYGNSGKEHLQMSMKILHTRVFGQFTAISLMLGIMGFKSYMDANGRFITEVEADRRVEEMRLIRENLLDRLEYEQHRKEQQEREIAAAHHEVLQHEQNKKASKKNKKNSAVSTSGGADAVVGAH